MKHLLLSLIVTFLFSEQLGLGAIGWDRSRFLGPRGQSPEVERYIQLVRNDRNFLGKLGKLRSPDAMTALLRIAYNADTNSFSRRMAKSAAVEYVLALADKAQARALLAASDPEVLSTGLPHLIGQEVDSDLLVRLPELAESPSCLVRSKVAFVLRDAPNTSINQRKAEILLQSMRSIMACDDATNTLSFGDNVFTIKQSLAQHALSIHAFALGTVSNLPSEFWAKQKLPPAGPARDYMVLGRVLSGVEASRAEARTILKSSPSVPERSSILIALMRNPGEEDIAAVRWVAEHDTFKTVAMSGYFNMPNSDQSIRDKPDSQREVFMLRFLAAHELRLKGL